MRQSRSSSRVACGTGNLGCVCSYETGGKSHITSFYSETSASDPSSLENRLGILNSSKSWEGKLEPSPPSSYGATSHTVSATGSSDENTAAFEQHAVANDEKDEEGHDYLYKATVTISQTEGPSASFNTTSSTTKSGQPNVLYGNQWIGSHTGGFEVSASDPGIGISRRHVSEPGWSEEINLLGGGACAAGVQCETHVQRGLQSLKNCPMAKTPSKRRCGMPLG